VLFLCECVGLVLLSERIRAFIAIDIEDPVIVGRIVNIRDAFVGTGAPMKPVEDYNLHLTIRFPYESCRRYSSYNGVCRV